MAETETLPHVMVAVVELTQRLGVRDIGKLPGCWECQINKQWWLAWNGHDKMTKCSTGASVPEFSIYFTFNGWPCGIVGFGGGALVGMGAAGESEDTLIKAINAAPVEEASH